MRHQAIFVAAYVKDHAVITYEIDGRSKHRFHITRSMPLRPLNHRIPSTKWTFGLPMPQPELFQCSPRNDLHKSL